MNALKKVRDQSIVFICGKRVFSSYGRKLLLKTTPFALGGLFYIPLRCLAAELFYDYSAVEGMITLSQGSRMVKIKTGAGSVRIKNKMLPLSGAVFEKDGFHFVAAVDAGVVFNLRVFFSPDGKTAAFSRQDLDGVFDDHEVAGYLDKLIDDGFGKKRIEFYASPGSMGVCSGTPESPFGTLERVKQAVRECVDFADGDITVYLAGGDYRLDETFTLSGKESGRSCNNVIFKAYGEERPVISGAEEVTEWDYWRDGIYRASIGDWNFETLMENGVRGKLARFPNEGYARLAGNPGLGVKDSFKYDIELPELERPKELRAFVWPGGPDGYWNWYTNDIFVSDIDYRNKTVYLMEEARYDLGTGSRFFFQGAKEFLDSPGEYYMDRRENLLYYMPRSLPIENQKITISKVGNLVEIKPSNSVSPARNIVFEGIEFTGAGENAIHVESACNITLKDCHIYGAGLNGVYINGKSQNNEVRCCSIHDIGENGVYILGNLGIEDSNNGHRIISNHIYNGGRTVGSGAGVMIEHSSDNVVAYNQISDMPRYGITLKSMPPGLLAGLVKENIPLTSDNARLFTHNTRNLIIRNNLYDLNNDSQDSGAIESWGAGNINKDTSNVIAENWIHDVDIVFSYGHIIYLDDQSDGFEVYGNVISHVNHNGAGIVNGLIMAKGINNDIINNIAADALNSNAALLTQEADGDLNYGIGSRQNVFYEYGNFFYSNFDDCCDEKFKYSDFNLFYKSKGGYETSGFPSEGSFISWKNYKNGRYDANSLTTDPLFMSPGSGDYRLRYDSPAHALGVRDIPFGDIGLTQEFKRCFPDTLEYVYFKDDGRLTTSSAIMMSIGERRDICVFGRTRRGGFYIGPEDTCVTFTSGDRSIATIGADGVIVAEGKGVCRLTASVTYNGDTVTRNLYVLVGDTLTGLDVMVDYTESPEPGWLPVGGRLRLIPVIETEYRRFSADYDDDTSLTFTSLNDCASADTLGNVAGVSEGLAVVEVCAKYAGAERIKTVSIAVGPVST